MADLSFLVVEKMYSDLFPSVYDSSDASDLVSSMTIGGAALAYVGVTSGEALTSGTTVAATAASHTTGNLLVVVVAGTDTVTGNRTVSGIADTATNTYTLASGTEKTFWTTQGRIEIWYAKNITGNASNVVTATFSGNCTNKGIIVYEFSGADTSAPLDKTASASATSGTAMASASTTTTSTANEILVGGAMNSEITSQNLSVGSPWIGLTKVVYNSIGAEYQIVSSTGTYQSLITSTQSGYWGSSIATFK